MAKKLLFTPAGIDGLKSGKIADIETHGLSIEVLGSGKSKRPLITVDEINRNEGFTFGCRLAHPARGVACDLAKAHLVVENGKAARLVHLLR